MTSRPLLPLVLLLASAGAHAQILNPPSPIPSPFPPRPIVLPETERFLWSSPGSAMLQVRNRLLTSTHSWSFTSDWAAIGAAGNRLLWQNTSNGDATLWKLDDSGAFVSFVNLSTPGGDYRAKGITLANTYVGSCYSRADSQRYYVLWVNGAGQMYLDLIEASGFRAAQYTVAAPGNLTAPGQPVTVSATFGGTAVVYHVTPASGSARFEIRDLDWDGSQFTTNVVLSQFNLPPNYVPVGMNAAYSSVYGWMDQVLMRVSVGSGSLWSIGYDLSPPVSPPYFIGEAFYPYPSQGWQAQSHVVNPSICP